jgi:hypothetical protein
MIAALHPAKLDVLFQRSRAQRTESGLQAHPLTIRVLSGQTPRFAEKAWSMPRMLSAALFITLQRESRERRKSMKEIAEAILIANEIHRSRNRSSSC